MPRASVCGSAPGAARCGLICTAHSMFAFEVHPDASQRPSDWTGALCCSGSKGGLVRESALFLRHAGVFHFFLLSRDFALGRLTLVQPDGLRVCGACEGL